MSIYKHMFKIYNTISYQYMKKVNIFITPKWLEGT